MNTGLLLLIAILGCFHFTAATYSSFPSETDVCSLPPDIGRCRGNIKRYYYDDVLGICRLFFYGGCGGNGNRFDSMADCAGNCTSSLLGRLFGNDGRRRIIDYPAYPSSGDDLPQNPNCTLDSDPGPCFSFFRRYFYNARTKSCEIFIYGGCLGNENNFETLEECLEQCPSSDQSSQLQVNF